MQLTDSIEKKETTETSLLCNGKINFVKRILRYHNSKSRLINERAQLEQEISELNAQIAEYEKREQAQHKYENQQAKAPETKTMKVTRMGRKPVKRTPYLPNKGNHNNKR